MVKKMKKCFIICFLFCVTSLYSQDWVKDGNGIPERVAINDFVILNNELYACGHYISEQFTSEARLYKTSDGKEWNQISMSGLGLKTMNAMIELNGTLFAAGSISSNGAEQKYRVYCSKDNGSNWTEIDKEIPERVTINDFYIHEKEHLVAGGHFISEQFTSEPRYYIYMHNEFWVGGEIERVELKTINAFLYFNGNLFAAGSLSPNGAEQKYGIYCLKNNGGTWEKSGNGIPERVAINKFITIDDELYACGHYITEQFTSQVRLYKSKDNGEKWELVATPGLELLTGNAIIEYKGSLFVSGSTSQVGQQYGVYCKKAIME